jgi:hypothetical protein
MSCAGPRRDGFLTQQRPALWVGRFCFRANERQKKATLSKVAKREFRKKCLPSDISSGLGRIIHKL